MSGEVLTSAEYISHHMQNLTFGQHPDGSWGIAHGIEEAKEMGFWALHLDTLGFSIGLGVLFLYFFHRAAKQATADAPTGFQNFAEWIVEFIEDSVKGSFSGRNPLIAPLAITIFIWILLMNVMDLIAIDFLPHLAQAIGIPYFRVVPTADVNATFGMAFGVFFLILYYSFKIKGPGGFFGEFALQPFGQWGMAINLIQEGVNLGAKPI